MTNRFTSGRIPSTPVAIAGAVGSAALAAALLYVSHRKDRHKEPARPGPIPSGENPETD